MLVNPRWEEQTVMNAEICAVHHQVQCTFRKEPAVALMAVDPDRNKEYSPRNLVSQRSASTKTPVSTLMIQNRSLWPFPRVICRIVHCTAAVHRYLFEILINQQYLNMCLILRVPSTILVILKKRPLPCYRIFSRANQLKGHP